MAKKLDSNVYAMYKGDKFLNVGTIYELAQWHHCSTSRIKYYTYPSVVKRNQGNGLYVIKVEEENEELKYIKFSEGKRFIYYACNDGNVYMKSKSNGQLAKKCTYVHKRRSQNDVLVTCINSHEYAVHTVMAKAFFKEYKQNDVVIHINNDIRDCSLSNLKVVPRSEYSKITGAIAKVNKPVGLYENNKLVKTFRSTREAGRQLFCSQQMVSDYCNNAYSYSTMGGKQYDLRWI